MYALACSSRLRISGLVCVAIAVATSSSAAQQPANVSDAAKQLLETGWQPAFGSRKLVDQQFQGLPAATQADVRTKYAYGLVMIKQRRYAEAVETIGELVARDDSNVAALKAKVWLDTLTRKYSSTLVGMEKLAGLLKPQANGPTPDECVQTAHLMGVMFGFLEGPAAAVVDQAQRDRSRQKILTLLDAGQTKALEDGRRRVKEKFTSLVVEQEDATAEAKKEADRLREELLKAADDQRGQIAGKREQLTEEEQKNRAEFRSEAERLTAAERPLVEGMTRIERDAVFVENELVRIIGQIERLAILLDRERDPDIRQRLIRDVQRLEIRADRLRVDLLQIERQAAVAEARLVALRRQMAMTLAQYNQDLNRTTKERSGLERREKQVGAVERKARRTTGDRRRSRTMATRAGAFTTYAPFPLEEEKRRLLDKL